MAEWAEITLAEAAKWHSGGTPKTSEASFWGGDIPWISAASLKGFYVDASDRCVTELGAANGTRLVPEETVLLVVRGMSLKTELRMGITRRTVAFGQDCKALIPAAGIHSRFLAYGIKAKADEVLTLVDEAGHGTGRLQTDRLAQLTLPIPQSLEEQADTVALLTALDDKITLNEHISRTSLNLAHAVFRDATDASGEVAELGSCVSLKYGKALREPDRRPGEVPVFGCTGQVGWHDSSLTSHRGAVVGRKGANAGWVSWSPRPCWVIDTAFYADIARPDLSAEVVFLLLETANLPSLVGDSAVPGLNRDAAHAQVVTVPRRDATRELSERVSPLMLRSTQAQYESRALADLRDTLLPQLMSGKLRVRDAKKIVEDAV